MSPRACAPPASRCVTSRPELLAVRASSESGSARTGSTVGAFRVTTTAAEPLSSLGAGEFVLIRSLRCPRSTARWSASSRDREHPHRPPPVVYAGRDPRVRVDRPSPSPIWPCSRVVPLGMVNACLAASTGSTTSARRTAHVSVVPSSMRCGSLLLDGVRHPAERRPGRLGDDRPLGDRDRHRPTLFTNTTTTRPTYPLLQLQVSCCATTAKFNH